MLADVRDKDCLDISAEALSIGVTIARLAGGMINPLFREMIDSVVGVFTERFAISVSYATEVCASAMIEDLTVIGAVPVVGVNVSAGGESKISMWAPTTTALGCMPMLTSSEEVSTFGWGACSC